MALRQPRRHFARTLREDREPPIGWRRIPRRRDRCALCSARLDPSTRSRGHGQCDAGHGRGAGASHGRQTTRHGPSELKETRLQRRPEKEKAARRERQIREQSGARSNFSRKKRRASRTGAEVRPLFSTHFVSGFDDCLGLGVDPRDSI